MLEPYFNDIQSFIDEFEKKYDKKLQVIIIENNKSKNYRDVSKIKTLENIVIDTMHNKNDGLLHINSLKIDTRRREILIWVHLLRLTPAYYYTSCTSTSW